MTESPLQGEKRKFYVHDYENPTDLQNPNWWVSLNYNVNT